MQDRHERDRIESAMLGPAFQISWVMEKLHDKSRILPDPDIFTFDRWWNEYFAGPPGAGVCSPAAEDMAFSNVTF